MANAFESKYEVKDKIGEGSFSEVLKVEDRLSKLQFAAKKLKKRFKNIHDVLYCAEIIATQKLCRHPNVLYMLEYIYDSFGGRVVFIFELMDMSMYEYMKLKKRLSEGKVKIYLYQMLKGLEHLHNNGLFHRDIKPENILVKLPSNSQDSSLFETLFSTNFKGELVKLADLGSIRGIYSHPPYTEYISTRWYRSPECLLTMGNYGPKMDIWAVGCVFYEMLTMKPLFPGSNEIDQLSKIHALLGTPSNRLLWKFKKRSKNFENFPHTVGSGLGPLLCNITEGSQHLLKLMLQYDPEARSNIRRLLENKYFNKLRDDDLLRKYKNSETKSRLCKKGHGDEKDYLRHVGSSYSWKSNKFQNTVHGGYLPRHGPSPYNPQIQQQNAIDEHRIFNKEHAATTGNLSKNYSFPSNHHLPPNPPAVNTNNKHLPPSSPPPHPLQQQSSHRQQQNNSHHYGNTNRVHVLPLTDQILFGRQYSSCSNSGIGYGYGPAGAQGARAPPLQGESSDLIGRRQPVPGALYSRTTVDLPTISNHQRPHHSPPTQRYPYHHQSNTISTMIKQKPPVNQQPQQQQQQSYNKSIAERNNYNNNNVDRDRSRHRRYNHQYIRDESKGSKSKSNGSSMTGISGKGLGGGVAQRKSDKYEKDNYQQDGDRKQRHRQRSKTGQRLGVGASKLQQQQGGYGVVKTASSPARVGRRGRVIVGGDAQAQQHAGGGGMRNLRKRAASKSPQATPSKHLGADNQQHVASNSYCSGGTAVNHRWSDLKRQSTECHKQLDVPPLPVCRMNIGQSPAVVGHMYKGLASLGTVAVGGMVPRGAANAFRKTTSNLPQLVKKPLLRLPQPVHRYDSSAGKTELQARSFVLPKRPQGRHKLDTIVELKGRGSRKFK